MAQAKAKTATPAATGTKAKKAPRTNTPTARGRGAGPAQRRLFGATQNDQVESQFWVNIGKVIVTEENPDGIFVTFGGFSYDKMRAPSQSAQSPMAMTKRAMYDEIGLILNDLEPGDTEVIDGGDLGFDVELRRVGVAQAPEGEMVNQVSNLFGNLRDKRAKEAQQEQLDLPDAVAD